MQKDGITKRKAVTVRQDLFRLKRNELSQYEIIKEKNKG